MPELVGDITPADVAEAVHELLEHPEALQRMRDELRATVTAYSGQGREGGEVGGESVDGVERAGKSEELQGHDVQLRVSKSESKKGASDVIAYELLRLLGIFHRE